MSPVGRALARVGRLAATAALVCTCTESAAAQTTEPALKAAFLYNFAKFAEWPADALAPGQRLAMCVVGDAAVADALASDHQGPRDRGSRTDGRRSEGWTNPPQACHLLYVSASEIKRSAGVLMGAQGASVFTVSDADRFAESGGVAQLIVENERMRFAINIASAQRGRLNLSSKLLSLAKIVKDDREGCPVDGAGCATDIHCADGRSRPVSRPHAHRP